MISTCIFPSSLYGRILLGNCLESGTDAWDDQCVINCVPQNVTEFPQITAVEGNKAITGIGTDQSLRSLKSGALSRFEEKAWERQVCI